MNYERRWKDLRDFEALYYRRCSDVYGQTSDVDVGIRGKQPEPRFPSSISSPQPYTEMDDPSYARRKAKVLQKLNLIEQTTFVLIHEYGYTIAELARHEKVTRQAIYSRIERMIRKSKYCEISAQWGRLKPKVNQYG